MSAGRPLVSKLVRRPALAALALIVAGAAGAQAGDVGVAAAIAASPAPERPLAITVWYPAAGGGQAVTVGGTGVFSGTLALSDAPRPAGALPTVLLSHGGLRSAPDSGAWIGAALAGEGFLVAEVSAPNPAAPEAMASEIGARAADLSAALDALLADAGWRGSVDTARVAALGFALGGTAALLTAGATLDPVAFAGPCPTVAPAPDCAWAAARGIPEPFADGVVVGGALRDPRVGAAIAVDPEYARAIVPSPAGGAPTAVLGLGSAVPAPLGPGRVVDGAAPLDAFATCTAKGPAILADEKEDPALCGDASARAAAHAAIVAASVLSLRALLP